MKRRFNNVASFCWLAAAQCFLNRSLAAALSLSSNFTARSCTNDELAEYALLVAVGPAPLPRCKPAAGQVLFAPDLQSLVQGVAQRHSGLLKVSAQVQLHEPKPEKAKIHYTHLRVIQSDSNWCPLPCHGPSWELAGPKPEKDSPYVLLEAVIWRQFRNVTLYQFDAKWDKLARNSYMGLCDGKDWGCPAYVKHRDSAALITIGPWPEDLDWDPRGLSAYITKAFEKIFLKMQQIGGKDNSRIGITYSGHGGDADGSLFAGVVDPPDSVALLGELVRDGGKFSMFNWGTNCREGRWNMLAAMHPFADHILASDLNVGGLKGDADNPREEAKHIQAKAKLADVFVLKVAMENRQTIDEVVPLIIKKREEFWLKVMKDSIKKEKLRQSIAAFVSVRFPDFAASLKAAYQKLPVNHQEEVKVTAEASECDVLTVVRYIDKAASASLLQAASASLLQQNNVTRLGKAAGALEKEFLALRSEYASTQSLFSWKPVTNGLGFNFVGKWDHNPRCDLEAALGALGCGPTCKKEAMESERKAEEERTLRAKQDAIVKKEMDKVWKRMVDAEQDDSQDMSAEEKAREEKRQRERMAKHNDLQPHM